ncbi:hypothetical protein SAMN05216582_11910 [Selenomonas ruminantium]|uniref:Uncharacterized protein n=1 Tax=Selenomonas ruminantium TaxID=971 RepID=A0A1M6VK31_SELRU|nr:hypothetical protein [Selenomonas ruminantium]SHK81862.1 hypothetical protein SAMN05216582_11910 [Selenomonas ruminantium]
MGKIYDFVTRNFTKETPITLKALEKELPEVAKLGILFPDRMEYSSFEEMNEKVSIPRYEFDYLTEALDKLVCLAKRGNFIDEETFKANILMCMGITEKIYG